MAEGRGGRGSPKGEQTPGKKSITPLARGGGVNVYERVQGSWGCGIILDRGACAVLARLTNRHGIFGPPIQPGGVESPPRSNKKACALKYLVLSG